MQTKTLVGLVLTCVIVVFLGVYWVTEPGRQRAALERQTHEATERGAGLYAASCSACHGASGEGSVLGSVLRGSRLDDDVMVKTISRGVPGTVMSAWGKEDGGSLHRQQILDLVIFIGSLDSSAAATAPQ